MIIILLFVCGCATMQIIHPSDFVVFHGIERRRHDGQCKRTEHMDRCGCRDDGRTRNRIRGIRGEPCLSRGILSTAHATSGLGGGTPVRDPCGDGAGGGQGGGCTAPSGADTIRHRTQYGHAQPDPARCGEAAAHGYADVGRQPQCGHRARAEGDGTRTLPLVL